ncbi:MAG TPA: four helix bundle protein [Verrucomicrobiae bacterium]|nr:four helix bundle protein [Verrucomicrobiae bacterium]
MNPAELKAGTMQFAVRVLKLADALPNKPSGRTIANQVARSGCSVASNYRAALRGKSRADFINKITTVLEEADVTSFWIELTALAGLLPPGRLAKLLAEAEELTKVFNATRTTARNHKS